MLHIRIFYLLAIVVLFGCSNNQKPQGIEQALEENIKESISQSVEGTILQIVRIRTNLSEEELLKRARAREPQFEAIPGLIQKYYIKTGSEGEYGGIYIWDSAESLQAYKESELAASIPEAYNVIEAPSIEFLDILFQLRD
jgi:heme-degrading monooxygenase HmoA